MAMNPTRNAPLPNTDRRITLDLARAGRLRWRSTFRGHSRVGRPGRALFVRPSEQPGPAVQSVRTGDPWCRRPGEGHDVSTRPDGRRNLPNLLRLNLAGPDHDLNLVFVLF
jgi:hypothetical protein